jgi:hypothetical protein
VKPWRFQKGDLVRVYDNHRDKRSFKKLLSKWFGPCTIITIFFDNMYELVHLDEKECEKLIMTNLNNIFIVVELLFCSQNNKVIVGIDITPQWLLGVKVVTWKINGACK